MYPNTVVKDIFIHWQTRALAHVAPQWVRMQLVQHFQADHVDLAEVYYPQAFSQLGGEQMPSAPNSSNFPNYYPHQSTPNVQTLEMIQEEERNH
jgi:hypothetical protein